MRCSRIWKLHFLHHAPFPAARQMVLSVYLVGRGRYGGVMIWHWYGHGGGELLGTPRGSYYGPGPAMRDSNGGERLYLP
jgi:hypothetical protein